MMRLGAKSRRFLDIVSLLGTDILKSLAHPNIDKAEQLLDWEPTIDFGTGMNPSPSNYAATRSMVDWYLESKDWVSELKI